MVAVACLFLAAKVEEYPKFLDDVVRFTYHFRHGKEATEALMADKEGALKVEKDRVLTCERLVVSNMGFDLHVTSPHCKLGPVVDAVLEVAAAEGRTDLVREHKSLLSLATNFLNDSMHHLICLQHRPTRMAAIALAMAEKFMVGKEKIKPFPRVKVDGEMVPWWCSMRIVDDDEGISSDMMRRYMKDFHSQVYRQGGGATSVATASHATRKRPAPGAPLANASPPPQISPNRSSDDSIVESRAAFDNKRPRVDGTIRPPPMKA